MTSGPDAMRTFAATVEEATAALNRFNRRWRLFPGAPPVPAPVHGGTFYHCQHPVPVKLPKYDKLGRRTGRFYDASRPCGHRVRKYQTYVRHWRRKHAFDLDTEPVSL